MPTIVELMKLFHDYVGDCILLTELGDKAHPLSFDEWYVRIYERNIKEDPNFYNASLKRMRRVYKR